VVILDPPREGCEEVVLDNVFERIAPPRAIYVSCNPETLARDLQRIARHGYAIAAIQPVDMFPHTAHVETVVVMAKKTAFRVRGSGFCVESSNPVNREPGTMNPEPGTRNLEPGTWNLPRLCREP
jgi:hypothetical protein